MTLLFKKCMDTITDKNQTSKESCTGDLELSKMSVQARPSMVMQVQVLLSVLTLLKFCGQIWNLPSWLSWRTVVATFSYTAIRGCCGPPTPPSAMQYCDTFYCLRPHRPFHVAAFVSAQSMQIAKEMQHVKAWTPSKSGAVSCYAERLTDDEKTRKRETALMLPLLGCLIVEQLNVYRLPSQSDKKMSKCFFFSQSKVR